ncbi:unnamed protein product, partial [Prorocentrum cordatum]
MMASLSERSVAIILFGFEAAFPSEALQETGLLPALSNVVPCLYWRSVVRVYDTFVITCLSYIWQFSEPTGELLAEEASALSRLSSGPGGWRSAADLYSLNASIRFPVEFVCLSDAAWAAKLRVASTVVKDFSFLAAQLAEAQVDNLSVATTAKWRTWYGSHFASVLNRAVDQANPLRISPSAVQSELYAALRSRPSRRLQVEARFRHKLARPCGRRRAPPGGHAALWGAGARHRAATWPSGAQDQSAEARAGSGLTRVVPDSPDDVTVELITKELSELEWPDCTSRGNVKPDGQDSIKAMCLGMVKPYFSPVTASRRTRLLPNVTKLCTKFLRRQPDADRGGFMYTSIQLNYNYNAKMHVDKNNHGPSYIIGLGSYTKGGLWIYDPNGTDFQKVTVSKLPGYPHLREGDMAPGFVVDIKDRWLRFDGTIPHMALDFEGTRISIVYFSRKGSLQANPESESFLE